MKKLPVFGVFLLLLVGSMALANAEQEEGKGIEKLIIGTTDQISDIDIMGNGFGNWRFTLTDCGLLRYNSKGENIPDLAKSWETDDWKKFTFHLRDNAFFHDGMPITSNDFKFTIEYLLEKSPNPNPLWKDIESIEAPDNYTLIIELKEPRPGSITGTTPLPEHIFKDVEDPTKFSGKESVIGSGPYMFDSFDKAAGILTLKAFDKFWNGTPAIDTIEVRIFKNPDTMMLAFEKGEIDATYTYGKGIDYYYVPQLLKNDKIKIMQEKDESIKNVLWINTARSPYDNRDFRQALSYAINYEELVDLFTAGYGGIPDAGFISEGALNHINTRKLTYDVNKSKSMLDDAGFKDVDNDGLREAPDSSKLQPEMLVKSDNSEHVRVAEMLKKYFNDVGIDVKIKPTDTNSFGNTMDVEKTFDMAISGTTVWGMRMGAGYGSGYVDTRYYGWSMVSDPKYQSIVDQLKVTGDKDEIKKLASEIQNYYAEELPQISLYTMDVIQPYNSEYEGWEYNVIYGLMNHNTVFNLHKA